MVYGPLLYILDKLLLVVTIIKYVDAFIFLVFTCTLRWVVHWYPVKLKEGLANLVKVFDSHIMWNDHAMIVSIYESVDSTVAKY